MNNLGGLRRGARQNVIARDETALTVRGSPVCVGAARSRCRRVLRRTKRSRVDRCSRVDRRGWRLDRARRRHCDRWSTEDECRREHGSGRSSRLRPKRRCVEPTRQARRLGRTHGRVARPRCSGLGGRRIARRAARQRKGDRRGLRLPPIRHHLGAIDEVVSQGRRGRRRVRLRGRDRGQHRARRRVPHGRRWQAARRSRPCIRPQWGRVERTSKAGCRTYAKASTSCGVTTCATGTVTGNLCNGAGTCTPSTSPCGEYACNSAGTACNAKCTSDIECAADSFCTTTSACAKKKGNGTPCAASRECGSGRCVDGVCCNEPCSGQCESCAIKGSEGTCTATLGAPQFGRTGCSTDGTSCAGKCDGVNRAACIYAQSTETCGSSCETGKEVRRACDGKGACVESASKLCGAYGCDPIAGRCRETCGVDAECSDGYRCEAGACAPRVEASCAPDLRSSKRVDGTTDCGRFLCEPTSGLCRKGCTATEECAPGYVCSLATKDCVGAAGEAGDDGGCSVARGRNSLAGFLLALLALARLARATRAGSWT